MENNVFYHPDLKFLFPTPSGWKINNLPTQVQMVSPDEQAVMIFRLEPAETPKDAANKFISDNKLNLIAQKNLKVNGFDAEEVIASASTEQGVFQLIAYFIKKENNIFSFLGYSGQANYANYEGSFKTTMNGFQVLTDRSKLNRQPDRIRIKKVTTNTNLQNALTGFGVSSDDLAAHAQLNGGRSLTDKISNGELLKVVEKGN